MVIADLLHPSRLAEPRKDRHQTKQPMPLSGVVAVIGSDGSGKSTLTADLLLELSRVAPTQLRYLGQDSGNILRWIVGVPLMGPAIGRYLVRRSERAHAKDDEPSSPDGVTALVVHLLSRWRRHKFRKMLALADQNVIVLTDRYPQAEVPGFHFDGPGLDADEHDKGLVGWLAKREQRLYEYMASHVPALVIRLNIDAETAHVRKPDHKLKMLRDKTRVIPTLTFNGATIVDLDATAPYDQVLSAALAAAYKILNIGTDRSNSPEAGHSDSSGTSGADDQSTSPPSLRSTSRSSPAALCQDHAQANDSNFFSLNTVEKFNG